MIQNIIANTLYFIFESHRKFKLKIKSFSDPQIPYWLKVGWSMVGVFGRWLVVGCQFVSW